MFLSELFNLGPDIYIYPQCIKKQKPPETISSGWRSKTILQNSVFIWLGLIHTPPTTNMVGDFFVLSDYVDNGF